MDTAGNMALGYSISSSNMYSSIAWSTSGSGTFSSTTTLNTIYYPSTADKTTGNVNLTVTVWPLSPCVNSVSSTTHILFSPCTGIPEAASEVFGFTLAPNPSPGNFTLTVNGVKNQGMTITIFDAQSRTNYFEKLTNTEKTYQHQFDFSAYAKGIYFVKVQTDKQVKTEKLVVQ